MITNCSSRGVSPVIGVILLVALTVGLVIIASGIIFSVGEGIVSTTPNIDVETVQLSNNDIETTIIQNENVDELYIINENGDEIGGPRISEVGETYRIVPSQENIELGEQISVIVVMNDNDSVLMTFETKEN